MRPRLCESATFTKLPVKESATADGDDCWRLVGVWLERRSTKEEENGVGVHVHPMNSFFLYFPKKNPTMMSP